MTKKWGRGHRANYETIAVKVPLPVLQEVRELIDRFHEENDRYLALPVKGNWWEVLGVTPSASQEEIRAAYRKLARLYHPDTNLRRDARARFQALQQAYREARQG